MDDGISQGRFQYITPIQLKLCFHKSGEKALGVFWQRGEGVVFALFGIEGSDKGDFRHSGPEGGRAVHGPADIRDPRDMAEFGDGREVIHTEKKQVSFPCRKALKLLVKQIELPPGSQCLVGHFGAFLADGESHLLK